MLEILSMALAQVVWAYLQVLLELALDLALVLDLVALIQHDGSAKL